MTGKRSNIVPIYKGDNKKGSAKLLTSISLTSVISNFCQRTVKDRWVKYFEEIKTISNSQFWFRTGYSCTKKSFVLLQSNVYYSRKTEWADWVYLDLKTRIWWSTSWEIDLETGKRRWTWWKHFELDKRFSKGQTIEMRTVIRKYYTSYWRDVTSRVPEGSALAPINVSSFYIKWHDQRAEKLRQSISRRC